MNVTCTVPIELTVEKSTKTIVGFIQTYFKLIEIALFIHLMFSIPFHSHTKLHLVLSHPFIVLYCIVLYGVLK